MKIVNEGDTIGTALCDGCDKEVAFKVNKNRCVYYYCTNILHDHEGKKERCFTRQSFGREASKKIIEQFLAKENNNGETQPEQPVTVGTFDDGATVLDIPAAGKPAGKRGGILGAIEHFVTGD